MNYIQIAHPNRFLSGIALLFFGVFEIYAYKGMTVMGALLTCSGIFLIMFSTTSGKKFFGHWGKRIDVIITFIFSALMLFIAIALYLDFKSWEVLVVLGGIGLFGLISGIYKCFDRSGFNQ